MERVIIHKPDDRRANGTVVFVDFRVGRANADPGEADTFVHIATVAGRVLAKVSG